MLVIQQKQAICMHVIADHQTMFMCVLMPTYGTLHACTCTYIHNKLYMHEHAWKAIQKAMLVVTRKEAHQPHYPLEAST